MKANKSETDLLQPEQLRPALALSSKILEQLDRILLGQDELHRMVMVGILSQGHILLEGVPGVGKTALVKALGEILGLQVGRVQFTPDLMPGDILGAHILQQTPEGKRELSFQPGPVFTNLLLADEINRASPKTQSALLEAMQERGVTLMGKTMELPNPFFVLASQNPIELEGTYPLPEAQLDRFLFKLCVTAVSTEVLDAIVSSRRRGEPPAPNWIMEDDQLKVLFDAMAGIFLPAAVSRYVARLTAATHPAAREATDEVRKYVSYGASPRAAIAMAEAARANALLNGRPTVGFEDVRAVAVAAMNHRVILNYAAKFDGLTPFTILQGLLASLDETGANLPDDIEIAHEYRK